MIKERKIASQNKKKLSKGLKNNSTMVSLLGGWEGLQCTLKKVQVISGKFG